MLDLQDREAMLHHQGWTVHGPDLMLPILGDAKTGQEKWKFKTEARVGSSPSISDGVVYFGSLDNHLYAVDAKTGQEKWKFKTEASKDRKH